MADKKTTVKKLSQGYGYKYTDLSAIHEELERQGIEYWQETRWDEQAGADYIYTHLRYGEGEWEAERRGVKVIDTTEAKMNAAQAQGSGVTYARRYSLLMALGWATEDDDGASAGPKPGSKQPAKQTPRNKPWQKYGSGKPTEKQLNWIRQMLKEGGADEEGASKYLSQIKSFSDASQAIDKLKARLEEKKNEEPAPEPSDEELENIGFPDDFAPAEEAI